MSGVCRAWPGDRAAVAVGHDRELLDEFGWLANLEVDIEHPPQGLALFGGYDLLRRVMDPDHRIAHWSQYDRGGHFPAMEVPDLLVNDVRTFFRRFR